MLRLYRIKDWHLHFETHESRKYKRLDWVRTPNKHDGLTYSRVAAEKDGIALFGTWGLIVQVASKCEPRGTLQRDGVPLSASDLSAMTRFPAKCFERALTFFAQDRIGWMTCETFQTELPLSSGDPAESPGAPGSHTRQRREEEKTEDKKTGEESTRGGNGRAAGAAPADDDKWLEELSSDPAYRGIDVRTEHRKMVRWCLTKKRQPTRMRFINWLNRCDKPLGTEGNRASSKPPIAEPKGWKAFINHEWPDCRYATGSSHAHAKEAHQWSDIDRDNQEMIVREMRKKGEL